jgi:hypothetical protein
MTPKQRIHLMRDLWPAACAAQGWAPNNRALRLTALSHALGRAVTSANEIATNDDFDRVKRYLRMAADDVGAAMERESDGRARRVRERVRAAVRELEAVLGDAGRAAQYVAEIIAAKFNHAHAPAISTLTVEDLTAEPIYDAGREHPSQLDQLLMTLTARLKTLRAVPQFAPAPTADEVIPHPAAEALIGS